MTGSAAADGDDVAGGRLGERIRELRVKRRWSQSDLASEAGVSRQYLGQIERGDRTSAGGALLDRIAGALGWGNYHQMMESEKDGEGRGGGSAGSPSGDAGRAAGWDGPPDDDAVRQLAMEGAEEALRRAGIRPVVEGGDDDFVKVKIEADVSAGGGSGGAGEGYVYIEKRAAWGRNLMAARVRGECMAPVLFPGDVVVCDRVLEVGQVPTGSLCVVVLLDEGDGEQDGGNVKYVHWISGMARLRAEDKTEKLVARDRVKVEGKVWRMIREF